jgi:ATP-dependent Clp protease protease subunit
MPRLNKDELDRYFIHSVDVANRVVYISSGSYTPDGDATGVDSELAERVIKSLHVLDHQFEADDKPITIQLNCRGGDYVDGMAIYDAIKECKNHVTIKVYGQASSMGSIILQAADVRIMSPNSTMMLHYGYFSVEDTSKSATNHAEYEKKTRDSMDKLYLDKIREKHPKYKLAKLQEMLNFDTILTAKEAVELGLADAILGEEKEN